MACVNDDSGPGCIELSTSVVRDGQRGAPLPAPALGIHSLVVRRSTKLMSAPAPYLMVIYASDLFSPVIEYNGLGAVLTEQSDLILSSVPAAHNDVAIHEGMGVWLRRSSSTLCDVRTRTFTVHVRVDDTGGGCRMVSISWTVAECKSCRFCSDRSISTAASRSAGRPSAAFSCATRAPTPRPCSAWRPGSARSVPTGTR